MPRKKSPNAKALVPTGAPYGQRGANEALASQLTATTPSATPPTGAPTAPTGQPDVLGAAASANFQPVGLSDPTQRPGEPLTTGLDMGAGAGSEVLNDPASSVTLANDPIGQTLRDLYAQFPYPGIRELIEDHDNG